MELSRGIVGCCFVMRPAAMEVRPKRRAVLDASNDIGQPARLRRLRIGT